MRNRWRQLELSEKLGYAWVVAFAILVLATAAVILGPAYLEYLEEKAAEEAAEKEGGEQSMRAPLPAAFLAEAEDGSLRLDRLALPARSLPGGPREG